MINERSAGAILFYGDSSSISFLLLRHPSGHWDFPKGHLEEKEEDLDAVKREIFEETGISEVKFIDDFHINIYYYYTRNSKKIHKEVSVYLAKSNTKSVKLSYEHTEFKWVKEKDVFKEVKFANTKKLIKKAIDKITELN